MIPAESQSSARLDLPYLQAGQMQKHVTLNDALTRLDALVQCAVVSRSVTEQPEAPDEGALYIVPDGATGVAWSAMAPGGLARFEADGWRTEGEGGTGDLRYVLNKEDGAKVLSMLFQSGWSGRAELGLLDDDDLVLKVSPDGDAWREALRVNRHTGRVGFPVMDALLRPATQDVLIAFATPPGRTRAFLIDDLIAALEAAGVWERLSALYLTAAHDDQAARQNLKTPGLYDLSPANDPAFAVGEGYTGDGVDAWLDTGLSALALADGGTGVAAGLWMTSNPSPGTSQFPLGPADGDETLSMAISPSTGNFSARVGSDALAVFGAAPAVTGHFCVSRTGATHVSGYHDGVLIGAPASAFTGYAGGWIGLFRRLTNHHNGTIAAGWLGKDLDAGQVAALHAALATYLSATGVVG